MPETEFLGQDLRAYIPTTPYANSSVEYSGDITVDQGRQLYVAIGHTRPSL